MNYWLLTTLCLWLVWCWAIHVAFSDDTDPDFKNKPETDNFGYMIFMMLVPVVFFWLGYAAGR